MPPIFSTSPMNQTIPKGQTASLSCSATGDPLPSIKWFKSQDSINNDLHFSILPNGTLLINSVSEQDSGWFTCRAMNDAGTVEKRAYLLVAGREINYNKEGTPKYANQWAGLFHYFLMLLQVESCSLDPGFKKGKKIPCKMVKIRLPDWWILIACYEINIVS